jgi:hypothetical protein
MVDVSVEYVANMMICSQQDCGGGRKSKVEH